MSVMKDIVPAIFTGGMSLPFTMMMDGGGKDKTPAIEAPKVMPTVDSESVNNARARAAVALQQKRGRASTMLSQNDDSLGV